MIKGSSVVYGDPGKTDGVPNDATVGYLYSGITLPVSAETEVLNSDGFRLLYSTILHETMHMTDGFFSGSWKTLNGFYSNLYNRIVGKDANPTNHEEIINRTDYEMPDADNLPESGGAPTEPVWSNGPTPSSPVGIDT